PRLLHQRLQPGRAWQADTDLLRQLLREQRRTHRLLQALLFSALGFLAGALAVQILLRLHSL
ncbi:MAG: hypothetical protein RJA10_3531, partial [Pseudomonadota bacterium]